jgi:phosphinothricin acetyltransferase
VSVLIQAVTVEEAERQQPALVALLQDVVDGGASVGFLPPLVRGEASEYWREVIAAVSAGTRVLLIARPPGEEAVGTVQLDLCTRPNGRHRAEVMKPMVRRDARRQGIARALMEAIETEARRRGRTTLVLDTRAGDPSEGLYLSLGYHRAGAIPRYAQSSDGRLDASAFYYRLLDAQGAVSGAGHARIRVRAATRDDADRIAAIYNEGIEDGAATFETRPRSRDDVLSWFDGGHPIVVGEEAGTVVAFGSTSTYRGRECYRGIAECSVYVARAHRGRGVGRPVLEALVEAAERAGLWKLVSRIFLENAASRRMCLACGFREVGVYEKHGVLDGVWRDCVIVERLLGAAARRERRAAVRSTA